MKTTAYALITPYALEKKFKTSLTKGLTAQQVREYQKEYGLNTLEEQEVPWWSILLRQFNTPFTYLLMTSTLLSFFLGDRINTITILVILLINGFLSFFQEYKAEQALKLLQKHLSMKATALREGSLTPLDSKELVPGDVVLLQTGDYVPADIILCEGSLQINESVLTGESVPVKKSKKEDRSDHETNICYSSTTVTDGIGKGIVVATGNHTMFGEIGRLTIQTIRHSGFQERITRLSMFIVTLVIFSLLCLFFFQLLLRGADIPLTQLLLYATALTLGLTPEALPAVITFGLSRGALRLARQKVIVKRLSAIEDLGALTILCTDKTGTLTENRLSVSALYEEQEGTVLKAMLFASKREGFLDPFDNALLQAASKELKQERDTYTIVKELPFNPSLRRNGILLSKDNETILIIRGSFESIKKHSLPLHNQKAVHTWIEEQSALGNRILAVASKNGPVLNETHLDEMSLVDIHSERDCTFLGLVAFADPLKPTSKEAVLKAHKLGVSIKMVTGDSPEVALAVARQIELATTLITGPQFASLSLKDKERAVVENTLFARILPQQKYEIVTLLKKEGLVGFLGEGINDAPALKAAHIGIVVEGSTDIAQDASDIVLLHKSLLVVIQGIAIGRTIFTNTMKYITTVVSSTFGNCCSIALASIILDFLPLLPLQILLLNMLCDLPMIAITTDRVDTDELTHPQRYHLPFLASLAITLGLTSSFFDLIMFKLFYSQGPAVLRTNWFVGGILTELTLIYSLRTKRVWYTASPPSFILIGISLLAATITIALPFTSWGQNYFAFKPPELSSLAAIGVIVISYFLTTDTVKLLYYRYYRYKQKAKAVRKSS